MNRRNFLNLLAASPLARFLKPFKPLRIIEKRQAFEYVTPTYTWKEFSAPLIITWKELKEAQEIWEPTTTNEPTPSRRTPGTDQPDS